MNKPDRASHQFDAVPAPRQKRADLVVDQIKHWIVAHAMQPGDALPREKELIEKIGVSRGTVKEALRALEFQGLIEITPGAGGGARIASISYDHTSQFLRNFFYFSELSWAQVYELRGMLEPQVAACRVGYLSDSQKQRLQHSIEVCRLTAESDEEVRNQRVAELDFHRILIESCPNPLLRFICTFINDLLADFAQYKDVIEPEGDRFRQENLAAHCRIMDACLRNDAENVEVLMREHIHDAGCFVTARERNVENTLLL
jgi:DNA-binding FadR family transcriptional regulator